MSHTEVARPDPDALLTPAEVASMFRVTPKTVTRWAEAGKLPVLRTLGGHRRFPAGAVFRLRAALDKPADPDDAADPADPDDPDSDDTIDVSAAVVAPADAIAVARGVGKLTALQARGKR